MEYLPLQEIARKAELLDGVAAEYLKILEAAAVIRNSRDNYFLFGFNKIFNH